MYDTFNEVLNKQVKYNYNIISDSNIYYIIYNNKLEITETKADLEKIFNTDNLNIIIKFGKENKYKHDDCDICEFTIGNAIYERFTFPLINYNIEYINYDLNDVIKQYEK